jgi:hypothetical protein
MDELLERTRLLVGDPLKNPQSFLALSPGSALIQMRFATSFDHRSGKQARR